MMPRNIVSRRRVRQSGSTILEFAICVPALSLLFFGSIGLGVMMGRYIQTVQVDRDVAHMYSDGVDFTQATAQSIIVQDLALGTGMTATGGNGVIIFSQIQTVYQADCTAANVSPCTNAGVPVFTQRIVVGNSSLRTSQFGTPTSSLMDTSGNISASVYLSNSNSTVRTSGFEAQLDAAASTAGLTSTPPVQPQGNIAYVVETFFPYPDIGFLGFSTAGGAYSCFIFN
jgi:Flp pilus assembly protein TadG